MSYLVFARKYRPGTFSRVVGQEQVTRTLANAIKRDKVAHAYLFAGPRGVGKTSIARIFSKSLNCQNGPTPEPCQSCPACLDITKGSSLAVREIDGASHNSVDDVRELIESFRTMPAPGYRYKIYIIDEVHMLSTSAFNALLKSLEEPPPNTVFILATTELHKIPETVISRCQRHDFRALTPEEIETQLRDIVQQEKLSVEPEVIRMVGRLAEGSMRDAQSLFDRVCAFSDDAVTVSDAGAVLGVVGRATLLALTETILQRDPKAALKIVSDIFSQGVDPTLFMKEFSSHWRELLIARFSGNAGLTRLGLNETEATELRRLAEQVRPEDLQDLVDMASAGADRALRSTFAKHALEALVVRLATRRPVHDLAALIDQLQTTSVGPPPTPPSHRENPAAVQVSSSHPKRSSPTLQESAAITRAATSETIAAPLVWPNFVQKTAGNPSARMLAEQLKRLVPDEFQPGILTARGPDFSIAYIQQPDNMAKLQAALAEFSGTATSRWTVKLSKGGGAATEPGSVLASEVAEQASSNEQRKRQAEEHPAIRSLQKAFPGTTIESVTLKAGNS